MIFFAASTFSAHLSGLEFSRVGGLGMILSQSPLLLRSHLAMWPKIPLIGPPIYI